MNDRGFTLIEIMVATATATILMSGIYAVFLYQQRIRTEQRQLVELQQNLRSTMLLLRAELRMAGYDPSWIDGDGDGRDDNRSVDGSDNDCDGLIDWPADTDEDLDHSGIVEAGAHRIQIRLDRDADANFCGSRELVAFGFPTGSDRNRDGIADRGTARLYQGFKNRALNQPVGQNIKAIGFAYAFDWNAVTGQPDGEIETNGEQIIWAVDADGDRWLDMALDSNTDGIIDGADDLNGDGVLNDLPLAQPVPLHSIRALRLWLLGRTAKASGGYPSARAYAVGSRIVKVPDTDRHRWMTLTGTAVCRNLGLRPTR